MDNFIGQYQLEDPSICDALMDLFHQGHKAGLTKPGVVGYDKHQNLEIKQSTDFALQEAQPLGPPQKFRFVDYHNEISKFIDNYCTERKIYEYCGRFEMRHAPQIQWYKPTEGFYRWHIDGNHELANRALAYITYLNDVEDGGTEFMHQGIKIDAVKGRTIIFPTSLTHIHRGVVSNTQDKYIITNWIYWDNSQ
jgi:hypothetical protein